MIPIIKESITKIFSNVHNEAAGVLLGKSFQAMYQAKDLGRHTILSIFT